MSTVLRAFMRHRAAIKRVLARYVPLEDRNDILQETFLKAFAAEATTPIRDAKAFLFRVAKNLAISEVTKKSRKTTDYLEDFDDSDVLESDGFVPIEEHIDGKRKLFVLAQAVAHLPEDCRRVFLMRKVDGLRFKQIATRLNVSVSTVEKRLAKALLMCDRYLRRSGYDPAEFGAATVARKNAGNEAAEVARVGADDHGF